MTVGFVWDGEVDKGNRGMDPRAEWEGRIAIDWAGEGESERLRLKVRAMIPLLPLSLLLLLLLK